MKSKFILIAVAFLIVSVGSVLYINSTGEQSDPMAEVVPGNFFEKLELDPAWQTQDFEVPLGELITVAGFSAEAGLTYVRTTVAYNHDTHKLLVGYKPVGRLQEGREMFITIPAEHKEIAGR